MARGMANGERIVSQARSKEFDEGYDRIFGPDRHPIRGHWIWDETLQRLVTSDEYRPSTHAKNAPIMMDRFYENTKTQTVDEHGKPMTVDIGSRRKHRAFMKERGLTTSDDFGSEWQRAQRRRDDVKAGKWEDPKRREALERAFYKIDGKP